MNDPEALALSDDRLTARERAVAEAIASPFMASGELTASDVARRFGCDVATIYRDMKKPDVVAEARALMAAALNTEHLPRLWQAILDQAALDPTGFGMKLAMALLDKGIHPFGTVESSAGAAPGNISVPASFEGIIGVSKSTGRAQ
jgi:hypothetical protein